MPGSGGTALTALPIECWELIGAGQGKKCIPKHFILPIFNKKAIFPVMSFLGGPTQSRVWVNTEMHTGILRAASFPIHQRNFTANSATYGRTTVPKPE